jgi:hypothetical protein
LTTTGGSWPTSAASQSNRELDEPFALDQLGLEARGGHLRIQPLRLRCIGEPLLGRILQQPRIFQPAGELDQCDLCLLTGQSGAEPVARDNQAIKARRRPVGCQKSGLGR